MAGSQRTDDSGGTDGSANLPGGRQPMFNLPSIIVWMLALMWLLQLGRDFLLTRMQDYQVLIEGGFIPLRYSLGGSEQSLAWLWTPVTYSVLHGGFAHLIVNTIWLMAFGAIVARRIETVKLLIFWILSSVSAAAIYWSVNQGSNVPMIGASGVVSALMGAAARFAFPLNRRFDRLHAHLLPLQSLQQAMVNRTVITYVAIWFAINAMAAFGFAAGAEEGAQIAWEAHIGGFLFGFFLFPLFDRRETS